MIMTNLKLKLILEAGLDNLTTGKSTYICDSIQEQWEEGIIKEHDFNTVVKWLEENKPTPKRHKKFFNHPDYIEDKKGETQGLGWWRVAGTKECTEQRIKFVKHLIKQLK